MAWNKLSPEIQQLFIQGIEDGNYYKPLCKALGITYQTFLNWMERGERAHSGPFREFYLAITAANARAEMDMVALWKSHMTNDWRAIRDFLARRFPTRWGARNEVRVKALAPNTEHTARQVVVTRETSAIDVADQEKVYLEDLRRLRDLPDPDPDPSKTKH